MITTKILNVLSNAFYCNVTGKKTDTKLNGTKKLQKKHLQKEKYEAERSDFIGR